MDDDIAEDHVATADAAPWEGDRVAQWLDEIDRLDRQLAPVDDILFPAAHLQPGERVVDVGCGDGRVTHRVAAAVGDTGSVVGLDISEEMLAQAARHPVQPGAAPIAWIAADVSEGPSAWEPGDPFDVVISRFGVMFFADPTAAFAALASATRPGGRLVAAVWRTRDESELMRLPLEVATEVLDERGCDYEPLSNDQGPFSLNSQAVADAVLGGTGWNDVTFTPHDLRMKTSGGLRPDAAAAAALSFGPAGRRVKPQDPDVRKAVETRLADVFADHVDASGHVVLGAAGAILSATRG